MTRYDRVIPPGGMGTVTLTIDTSRVIGEFQKRAVVWSNDLERRSIALYLTGVVKPFISLEPGGYVGLWGVKGQVPKEHIEIINNHKEPIRIIGIENDLPEQIRWHLEELKPGYLYRLEVEDISNKAGEYTGHLYVRTDYPQKPKFVIIVNGYIREK
ncbi:MAG: hypothetical protein JSV31_23350 [Desulfobacterales bacterium]|nr:MAG: hypothetical protein JSV31_23350 [Desulfobacterales bacterium]